jgi:hypothetical protein
MRARLAWLLVWSTVGSTGCIRGLTQVAGTGAIYHTRCSAEMLVAEGQYKARCTPDACAPGFTAGPVSHVVVALDPGRKVVGYAERVCLQDLSRASARFDPALFGPASLEQGSDPAE